MVFGIVAFGSLGVERFIYSHFFSKKSKKKVKKSKKKVKKK